MANNNGVGEIEEGLDKHPPNEKAKQNLQKVDKRLSNDEIIISEAIETIKKVFSTLITEIKNEMTVAPSAALIAQASNTVQNVIRLAKNSAAIIAMLSTWLFTANELLRATNILIETAVDVHETKAFRKKWKAYLAHIIKTSLALASAKIAFVALNKVSKMGTEQEKGEVQILFEEIIEASFGPMGWIIGDPMKILNIFGPVSIVAILRYQNQYVHTLLAIANLLLKTGAASTQMEKIMKRADTVASFTTKLISLTTPE